MAGKLTALWAKFSFMNHSCCMNTYRYSIGDFLYVLAVRPIKAGEEIFTSYIPIDFPLETRRKLLTWYKFKCECENCTVIENLSEEQKKILEDVWKEIQNKDPAKMKEKAFVDAKIAFFKEIYPRVLELIGEETIKNQYIPEVHVL